MRALLILVMFMLAVPVVAEDRKGIRIDAPRPVMTLEEAILGDFHDNNDPCLAKMEAAMKAMEFWSVLNFEGAKQVNLNIVQRFPYDNYWAVLPDESPFEKYTPIGLANTANRKAGEAIVLWDTVKRECWRNSK